MRKSQLRHPTTYLDRGQYMLLDKHNEVVLGGNFNATLEDIERFITTGATPAPGPNLNKFIRVEWKNERGETFKTPNGS